MPDWSPHASRRSAQRSVPPEDIDLAFAWGRLIRQRGGRVAYHLGRREAQRALKDGVQIPERAVGVAVIVANDDTVVTVAAVVFDINLLLPAVFGIAIVHPGVLRVIGPATHTGFYPTDIGSRARDDVDHTRVRIRTV